MNQAEEDALIDRVYADWIAGCDSGAKPVSELVRLAIRAAVAAERERCAFICQHRADVCREAIKTDPSPLTRMVLQYQEEQADDCAAAIRKG